MCRKLAYPCSHGIVDKCPAVGWLAPLTPTCWKIWCMCVCGMTRAAIDLGHALILVSMRNLNSNSLFLQLCLRVKGRSLGASLGAQMLKSLPTMQETWVRSLRQEDPLEKEMATHSSIPAGESHGQRSLAGYIPWGLKSRTQLSDFHFQFLGFPSGSDRRRQRQPTYFSTLAWKIPWMEEPGRLQSMGLLRVGHD